MVGETVSHHRILSKLGEGEMGEVYKAEDTVLKRAVALKFPPADLTSDAAAKASFVHEARAASALDHPNIGAVHEVDESEDGRSFISMALYDGETLKQKIACGPLDIGEALGIIKQVATGLRKAHDCGIIHRDRKPANIIVTADGLVKIVDFGLAKPGAETRGATKASCAGTAAYMAPEQIQNGITDARSDLFSVGVVMYEMLTGVRPFAGEHEASLFYSIVNNEPDPPTNLRPEINDGICRIVTTLLEKDPEKRFQSCGELIGALESLGTGTRMWRPRLLARRMTRPVRRHRLAAVLGTSLAAIVLLALLSGSDLMVGLISRAVIPSEIGAMYFYMNRWADARKEFDRSLEIQPNYPGYSNLGTLLYYQGHYEEAARAYESALRIDDHNQQVWSNLAEAYRQAGDTLRSRQVSDLALKRAEDNLRLDPNDPTLLVSLASMYAGRGNKDKVKPMIERAVSVSPDNVVLMGMAAMVYEQAADRHEALMLLARAFRNGYSPTEIENSPEMKGLRSDPLYRKRLKKRGGRNRR